MLTHSQAVLVTRRDSTVCHIPRMKPIQYQLPVSCAPRMNWFYQNDISNHIAAFSSALLAFTAWCIMVSPLMHMQRCNRYSLSIPRGRVVPKCCVQWWLACACRHALDCAVISPCNAITWWSMDTEKSPVHIQVRAQIIHLP